MLRVKLILIAFCMLPVAGATLWLDGRDSGIASVDQQAFDSYVHFAKQMHAELQPKHKPHAHPQPIRQSVFAAVDK